MARYRGSIYKRYGADRLSWVNTYTIDEVNSLEAIGVLQSIMAAEKAIHSDEVTIYRCHVVNYVDSSDVRSSSWNEVGERVSAGLGGPLPLFNTLRVVFSDGVKKPEQKYLRLPGYEANLTLGKWDGELLMFVGINYIDPLLALGAFVGPNGEHPTSGSPMAAVQNRQLGWHRRTRVGFHRGWVAN